MPLHLVKVMRNGWQTANFVALIWLIGVSHIPLPFHVPASLNYVTVFQFKLLHRKVATNCFLFKIGIKSNDQCSFCKASLETLLHLFWECPLVKYFWSEISNWMKNSSCFLNKEFTFLSCIGLLNDTTNLLFHHALLIARYHIYFSQQKGLLKPFMGTLFSNFSKLSELWKTLCS